MFAMVHLDDTFMYSNSLYDYKKHLRPVLDRLPEQKLYAKLSECKFGVQEMEYPSFIFRKRKLAINLNKTRVTEFWESSSTKKGLQGFLALINCYHRFIINCSKITKTLTELTKIITFNWSESFEKAFKNSERQLPLHHY